MITSSDREMLCKRCVCVSARGMCEKAVAVSGGSGGFFVFFAFAFFPARFSVPAVRGGA